MRRALARLVGLSVVLGLQAPVDHDAAPMAWVAPVDDAAAVGMLQVAPGIGAIRLPPAAAVAFAQREGLALKRAGRVRPTLDEANASTGVATLQTTPGLTGLGVTMGVIDQAFDVAHPAFRTATGESRIAWLLAAGPPAGLHPDLEASFGCDDPMQAPCAVYAGADLNALIASGDPLPEALVDTVGHGTHVASIAAGNGDASLPTPTYLGVAPEATLVLVATSGEAYVDTVLRGASFIFDRAGSAPAVVNLSSSFHGGPHDGSSALPSGLAAMVGEPGRAIVISAGNEGAPFSLDGVRDMGRHTTLELGEVPCPTPLYTTSNGGYLEIWLSHEGPLEVALDGPDGEAWLTPTAESGSSNGSGVTVTTELGETVSLVRVEGDWPANEDVTFTVSGAGYVDAWVHSATTTAVPAMVFAAPTSEGTVGIPGVHPALIAVGSTVNRTTWPAADGAPAVEGAIDAMAGSSSAGPAPGGWLAPLLSAPGELVVAALSADADPATVSGSDFALVSCDPPFASCAPVDDRFAALGGTSMAAPQVAGVAALLLEAEPMLTQTELRERLLDGAAVFASGAAGQPGGGALDAVAALEGPSADAGVSGELSWLRGYARRGEETWGLVALRDAAGRRVTVAPSALTLDATGGTVTAIEAETSALLRFSVRPDAEANAMTVSGSVDGVALEAVTLPVGLPATTCLLPTVASTPDDEGCGCRLASRAPARRGGWLLLAFAMLAWRRRHQPIHQQGVPTS